MKAHSGPAYWNASTSRLESGVEPRISSSEASSIRYLWALKVSELVNISKTCDSFGTYVQRLGRIALNASTKWVRASLGISVWKLIGGQWIMLPQSMWETYEQLETLLNPRIIRVWCGARTSKARESKRLWIRDHIAPSLRHRCKLRWTVVKAATSGGLSEVSHPFMWG